MRPVDHDGLVVARSLLDGPVTAAQQAMARDALSLRWLGVGAA